MRINMKRSLAITTALAAAASVSVFGTGSVSALPPGTPATPGQNISVNSGTNSTTFSLTLTAPNNGCPGNASVDGFRWGQYLTSASVDAGTLTWTASGPQLPAGAPAGAIAQPLYSTTGSPQIAKTTIGTASPYTISGTSTLNLNTNLAAGLVDGQYKIGFACYKTATGTEKYWETTITVKDTVPTTSLNWVVGTKPAAPVFTADAGFQEITGEITPVTATPAVTGYTVTATPTSPAGPALPPVSIPAGGPYTYSFTGLNNGDVYDIVATATNDAGSTAAAAQAVCMCHGWLAPRPVVAVASGPSPVTVSWTPSTGSPVGGATLVSHTVTFVPVGSAAPIASQTLPAPTNSISVACAVPDSYVVEVVGNYSNGQVTVPGMATFTCVNAQVVVQDITVVRPQGALVLTQRCGVHGSAPAYSNALFGSTLPALAATAGADPTGVAPNVVPPAAMGAAPVADALPEVSGEFGVVGHERKYGAGSNFFDIHDPELFDRMIRPEGDQKVANQNELHVASGVIGFGVVPKLGRRSGKLRDQLNQLPLPHLGQAEQVVGRLRREHGLVGITLRHCRTPDRCRRVWFSFRNPSLSSAWRFPGVRFSRGVGVGGDRRTWPADPVRTGWRGVVSSPVPRMRSSDDNFHVSCGGVNAAVGPQGGGRSSGGRSSGRGGRSPKPNMPAGASGPRPRSKMTSMRSRYFERESLRVRRGEDLRCSLRRR